MPLHTVIELIATLFGLLYVVLLIRERVLAWPFGIAGSLLSIYLFIDARIYSEALLYSYYVLMGAWGWARWHKKVAANNNPVVRYSAVQHLAVISIACGFALALGSFFDYNTDAQRPYFDALTTAFSFAATYMEVKKVLETWLYWIVINIASIWLYQDRDLDIYATLIGVYGLLSVWGFIRWLHIYRGQQSQEASTAMS